MSSVIKNHLTKFGYNLVALPKEGIEPLLLLYENHGDVSSAGIDISELFAIGKYPTPTIKENIPVANLEGKSEITFDGKAGINILDWLLQKLKMGKLMGELSAANIQSINISYKNILSDEVPLGHLDNFLTGSEPEVKKFTTFRKKLEKSQLYVVNSVLKSNSFSISGINKNGQKVDLQATIKGIVEAEVEVEQEKENSLLLKHDSVSPIVFAFKAQRIIYDDKKWWQVFKERDHGVEFRIKDQHGVVLRDDSRFPTQSLQLDNELVKI